jgi:hypothetical protein
LEGRRVFSDRKTGTWREEGEKILHTQYSSQCQNDRQSWVAWVLWKGPTSNGKSIATYCNCVVQVLSSSCLVRSGLMSTLRAVFCSTKRGRCMTVQTEDTQGMGSAASRLKFRSTRRQLDTSCTFQYTSIMSRLLENDGRCTSNDFNQGNALNF